MCGRFVMFTVTPQLLAVPGYGPVRAPQGLPRARYNIAPTQPIAIVRALPVAVGEALAGDPASGPGSTGAMLRPGDGQPREAVLSPARWGLVPPFARGASGPTLFNARAETVQTKPSFRGAFKRQRCVIPMDGYYEWHERQPYWIRTPAILWAAGLWEMREGQLSATILTVAAAPPLDRVHHRMPRFLFGSQVRQWLEGSAEQAAELLCPTEAHELVKFQMSPANSKVGNVRNDAPWLLEADAEPPAPPEGASESSAQQGPPTLPGMP